MRYPVELKERAVNVGIGAPALLAVVLGGGMALAADNASAPTVYTGCLNKAVGVLYNVTTSPATPRSCFGQDLQVSWNRTGPAGSQGTTGPAGPQGPAGLQGPTGKPGVSGASALQMTSQTVDHLNGLGSQTPTLVTSFAVKPNYSYVINAKAEAWADPNYSLQLSCELYRFDAAGNNLRVLDRAVLLNFDNVPRGAVALAAQLNTTEGGSVRMICDSEGPGGNLSYVVMTEIAIPAA